VKSFLGALVLYAIFVKWEHGMGFTWGAAAIHSSLFGFVFWLGLSLPGPDGKARKQAKALDGRR
jgi:hypothetical protein